jgi:hypothetical protein
VAWLGASTGDALVGMQFCYFLVGGLAQKAIEPKTFKSELNSNPSHKAITTNEIEVGPTTT